MGKSPHVGDIVQVYNNLGVDIDAGTLLATAGWSTTHNAHLVVKAQANSLTTLAEFVAVTTIGDGKKGVASREFVLTDVTTSSAAADEDPIFLSASSAGAWTATEPTGTTAYKQKIGSIAKYSATALAGAVHFDVPPTQVATYNPSVVLTDPGNGGAIPVTRSGCVPIVTAGAETRSLAIPTFLHQYISLFFKTDGGDCVVTTASAFNQAGNTHITMNDANDFIGLRAEWNGTALVWRVAGFEGVSFT